MKYLISIVAMLIFAGTAEANFNKPHNEYGKLKVSECEQIKCGDEAGKITYTIPCNSVNSWGINMCKEDKVLTKDCNVKEPVQCEEEGVCPTECGMDASEVADGNGGTKVCEATQGCIVPMIETEDDEDKCNKPSRPHDLVAFQGLSNDGSVLLQWVGKTKNVEIRYGTLINKLNKKIDVKSADFGTWRGKKLVIGLENGKTYFFQVRKENSCGHGQWSKIGVSKS